MIWTPEQCHDRITKAIFNGEDMLTFWRRAHKYFSDNIDAPDTVQNEATLVAEWDKINNNNGEQTNAKESFSGSAARIT